MSIGAFLFDMDGVIVNSNPFHTQAWEEYLRQHHLEIEELEARMVGRRNDEIVRDFFGSALSEQEVFAHGAAKEALYRERMHPVVAQHLFPGVREFLERHRGVPTGLASNAEPANVAFVLDAVGLRPFFTAIVDGFQVQRPKPFPDIYIKVAELLGVPPAECVVFEDSPAGIAAGRAAGARVVGVQSEKRPLEGVELVIADFTDQALEGWLASQAP